MIIRKAVFPVGGLGTRFLPATKAIPKEMLPVVDKPLMQYAVEEAYAAGIREMIFVTGRHKRAIEDHFDTAYELEVELEAAGKGALLELVHSIKPADMDCVYVRQPRALGLGHAVLCAERLVGNEPFAVLLADDLMMGRDQASGGPTVLQQMVQAYESSLTPAVFESIRRQPRGAGGEIQLTDGIAALIGQEKVQSFRYDGQRYDCGSKEGFLEATIDLALANRELSASVRAHLDRIGR
jgi:UTP--glucose-1-phosphate uridylyltransferase